MGVFWIVLPTVLIGFVPDNDGGDITAFVFGCLIGWGWVALGTWMARDAARALDGTEHRIWLENRDLWWTAGAEPARIARDDIVEVGLGAGDATVVAYTVDGGAETLTDLGTPAQRIAVATAIGDAVGSGVARVHPELPPDLPGGWARRETMLWRRPNPAHRWGVVALAVVVIAGTLAILPYVMMTPLMPLLLPLVAFAHFHRRLGEAFRPTGPGWRVETGALVTVGVETGSGDQLGSDTDRRVVALVLTRRRFTGRARLDAVFDDGNRCTIMTGGRKVERFARCWPSGPTSHWAGRDRDDVAARQVNL